VPGRDRFNTDELAWIREQLVQLRVADRDEQKRIRGRLRSSGFRISDWTTTDKALLPLILTRWCLAGASLATTTSG
jgi:hypothetical protein